eukprot:313776_1
MISFVMVVSFVYCVCGKTKLEIIKANDIINISNEYISITGNIAVFNDEYFLVSYENATPTINNMTDLSMMAQIYDVKGQKINKEPIVLAPASAAEWMVFAFYPSQCQCNSHQDHLMYGWISENHIHTNASYEIIYSYDSTDPNTVNKSQWTAADNTNIHLEEFVPAYEMRHLLLYG